jgi:hypothetical protein
VPRESASSNKRTRSSAGWRSRKRSRVGPRPEAHSILEEAQDRTDAMRREAEDYVDAKLAQFEIALRKILEDTQSSARSVAKTLDQVEVGREHLRAPRHRRRSGARAPRRTAARNGAVRRARHDG